eukprot:3586381-Pleurochrysis_carterae.AAC.2
MSGRSKRTTQPVHLGVLLGYKCAHQQCVAHASPLSTLSQMPPLAMHGKEVAPCTRLQEAGEMAGPIVGAHSLKERGGYVPSEA